MNEHIEFRIASCVLTVLSLFLLPWWLFVPIALLYTIYYTPVYEVIALGFLADQVYGVSYTYTLTASVIFILIYFIKSQLRS